VEARANNVQFGLSNVPFMPRTRLSLKSDGS